MYSRPGTPPALRVRLFQASEWPTYRNLRLQALADSPEAFGSTYAGEAARPEEFWPGRLSAGLSSGLDLPLLAELDGQPVGLAWGRIEAGALEVVHLYQVWVAPVARGRGAGRMLVQAVIAWAAAQGARAVELEVTCGDTPAVRLYNLLGFRPIGEPGLLRPGSPLQSQNMRLELKRILIAYASMAGSTAEVARVVGDELAAGGLQVDVLPIEQVAALTGYDGVVVGGPMILGWHRGARRFLHRHRAELQRLPLAVFVLAMSLTRTDEIAAAGPQVTVDPNLPKPPKDPAHLAFRERYAGLGNYLKPVYKAIRPAQPVSIGVFGGRMEYGRLKWWAVLFAMLVVKAPAGEKRNWEAIRAWARGLPFSG
jgi:menaquinone-dependent protoporphyrinogen IX oxidase/ribosomal protein S18 acetylase RimI-like enzyme